MEIITKEQFVSIPRLQYEEMERIVKEKKDIEVYFGVCFRHGFSELSSEIVSYYTDIRELNDKVDLKDLDKIQNMVSAACDAMKAKYENEILDLRKDLTKIKSKWWYKLFN